MLEVVVEVVDIVVELVGDIPVELVEHIVVVEIDYNRIHY
jgi:hypothetical protein